MTARPTLSEPQLLRLKDLFDRAIETDPGSVDEFIRSSTGGDELLERELRSLVDAHSRSFSYFDQLAEEMVSDALSALDLREYDEPTVDEKTIRHYEVLDRIGGGGMGVVFKARDTRLGRTVALKFLPPRYASSPAARTRLLAEARAASALDHPNIGVVHEIAETEDGRPFIAMAWYDGETLKARARSGQINLVEATTLGLQLASALDAAHSAGVIHRDVKPANVMITRAGVAKLVDFGIAKFQSVDDGESQSTAGTIAYMSPEQTRAGPLDARTDIWSLGVLLYEVIAGQRPFRGTTDSDIIAAIQNETPAELASLRSDIDSHLSAIVSTCLSKDPEKRYRTAGEVGRALQDWNPGNGPGTDERPFLVRWLPLGVAATIAIALAVWGYSSVARNNAGGGLTGPELSVAVLPFARSGADSLQYIGAGLGDDLRAELSRVTTFAVPSFEGTVNYARGGKAFPDVAKELTADYLVTGAISGTSGRRALRLELIDGKSGRQVWSNTFDAAPEALPHIPRNAALGVFDELGVRVDDANRRRLSQPPTANPLAYDLYLRGRHADLLAGPATALGGPSIDSVRRAQALYAQAKTLDPGFTAARARLAVAHMATATAADSSTTRREQARVEAEVALRADSLLPDAHDAIATYWVRSGDRGKQIETLERALRIVPNSPALMSSLASAYIVSGRWEDGVAMYDRATTLDPRNPRILFSAATTFGRLRRQERGMPLFKRLIEISPNDHEVRLIRGQSWLRWKGTTDTLLAAVKSLPPGWDERGMATYSHYTALRAGRRYVEILSMLDSSTTEISMDGLVYHPRSLMRAEAYHGLGDVAQARRHYELARVALVKKAAAAPSNASIQSALGLAYAGLGRKREAIAAAERAMDLVPFTSNANRGTAYMGLAVEIFARVGELDRAFEMIDLMLTMPSGREISIPYLKAWPSFDPLRADPRFDAVLRRYEAMYPTRQDT